MFRSFATSFAWLATKDVDLWCALAAFVLVGLAPLSAQSNGTLEYVDHQNVGFTHDTVLSTNISLYQSPYYDAGGNILPAPRDNFGRAQPLYLYTTKEIYYYQYDSESLATPFPLVIPFGVDITLNSGSEVSYDARVDSFPVSNQGFFQDQQLAALTGTRNSLYYYNISNRMRNITLTLSSQPGSPTFVPGNALLKYGTEGTFVTSNGGVYYLSNDQLSVSDGHLTPLVTAQGSGPGELNNPSALNIGPDGLLYVLDAGNHRIQKFELGTGTYRGGFDLPNGLTVYSQIMELQDIGGTQIGRPAQLDANGNYIYTNTSGNVFSTSLAISQEGHIYLGDGAGGGFVLNLEGNLLSTFHPPTDETGFIDEGLVAGPFGKLPGAGSFLTYDGYGTVFTYVEGKGIYTYRDPTYPMRPSLTGGADMDVAGDRVLSPGENGGYALNFQQGGKLVISGTLAIGTGFIYMYGDGSIEAGGTLATDGDFVKAGTGTLTLNNENTYAGKTIVLTGKLILNGSIAGDAIVRDDTTLGGSGVIGGNVTVDNGGTLSPGNSPGQLTIEGDLILSDGSILLMQIGGTEEGLFDQLTVTGNFLANGILSLQLVDGYAPNPGDSFLLFTGGGLDFGDFTSITTNLGAGLTWDTSQLGSTGLITAVPEPSTWALLGLGLFSLGIFHWRSRRSLPRF